MRFFSCLILFLAAVHSYAQGPANNWYFGGGAGINFSTSPPTVLNDGKLNTLEGCASISNDQGQLLFYTDGTTVFDRNGDIMENGEGLFGDQSSTQSAIIIPKPLSTTTYYVFTVDVVSFDPVDRERLITKGVNYSVVDFTSNPNGIVTSKNIRLLNFSAEKLSAVIKGCDSDSVWMVALSTNNAQVPLLTSNINFNTFYAYEITPAGITPAPVKSSPNIIINDQRGNLKFSPNGEKLISASVSSGLHSMDFDSQSGRVSNPLKIGINSFNNAPYGVEFSPNNRFLYVHSSNNADVNMPALVHFSSLIQFDLENGDIEASQVLLDEQNLYRGSLQLGPDGKIYRSLSAAYREGLPYLGVIENPNEKGTASNYRDRAIFLGDVVSYQGLPPFNQSLFNKIDIIGNNISTSQLGLCEDQSYTLRHENVSGADYTWYKNDVIIPDETSNTLNIKAFSGATLPLTETYKLILNLNDGSCEKTGTAEVTYYPLAPQPAQALKLVQCQDAATATGLSVFNLNELIPELTGNNRIFSVEFYENAANAAIQKEPLEAFGYKNKTPRQTIFARVSPPVENCEVIIPFELIVSSTKANRATLETCDLEDNGLMNFDLLAANQQLLAGQPSNIDITYYQTSEGALLEDPELRLTASYTNTQPYNQLVYARLENNNSCYSVSEIELTVIPRPQFELTEDVIYCSNSFPELITVNPEFDPDPSQSYFYQWLPEGQTTRQLKTNLPGTHTLTITNTVTGCFSSASVTVLDKDPAVIENIQVTDASSNNSAVINISGKGNYEFSLSESGPYQDNNDFNNLTPGFYTAFVRSREGCGITKESFSIIGFPDFFTPNGDGYNDFWQVDGISETVQPGSSIRIFDRYGQLLIDLDPLSGWDGTVRGRMMPSDDYWFRILLQDGREFKSHFTLKR